MTPLLRKSSRRRGAENTMETTTSMLERAERDHAQAMTRLVKVMECHAACVASHLNSAREGEVQISPNLDMGAVHLAHARSQKTHARVELLRALAKEDVQPDDVLPDEVTDEMVIYKLSALAEGMDKHLAFRSQSKKGWRERNVQEWRSRVRRLVQQLESRLTR